MLEALLAYPPLGRSLNTRTERWLSMTKRQIAFGATCFLIGILVGIEIAENLAVLVRLVIIVAILLLCVYLVLPYLRPRTPVRRGLVQRVPQRRTQRKP